MWNLIQPRWISIITCVRCVMRISLQIQWLLVGQTQQWKSTKAFLHGEKIIKDAFYHNSGCFGEFIVKFLKVSCMLVPERSTATLLPIIQGAIRQGTTVVPYLWRAYGGVTAMEFNHLTVNHSINFASTP